MVCLLLPLETKCLAGCWSLPGALLKAAFICAGIVQVRSKLSLSEQLLRTFGGGFELHTWSELPHGSGLGEWPCPAANHSIPAPSLAFLPPHSLCPTDQWGGAGLGCAEVFHARLTSSLPCRHQQHPGGHCPGRLAAGRRPEGEQGGPDPRSAAPGAGAHHRYGTTPAGREVTGISQELPGALWAC